MGLYLLQNGPIQGAAALPSVTTSNVIKTMLQFKPGATKGARIVEWGCSFDGSAAAVPGKVELIETDAAATVSAYVAADITKYDADALNDGDMTTALIAVGSTSSGYTASNEGSPTTGRILAGPQLVAPTSQFIQQFPLGREPYCQKGLFTRIRVTFAVAVNCYCYMIVQV